MDSFRLVFLLVLPICSPVVVSRVEQSRIQSSRSCSHQSIHSSKFFSLMDEGRGEVDSRRHRSGKKSVDFIQVLFILNCLSPHSFRLILNFYGLVLGNTFLRFLSHSILFFQWTKKREKWRKTVTTGKRDMQILWRTLTTTTESVIILDLTLSDYKLGRIIRSIGQLGFAVYRYLLPSFLLKSLQIFWAENHL